MTDRPAQVYPLWKSAVASAAGVVVMAALCVSAGMWYKHDHSKSQWRSAVVSAPGLLHSSILNAIGDAPSLAADPRRIRDAVQAGPDRWLLDPDIAGRGWLLNPRPEAWTWEPGGPLRDEYMILRADPIESSRLPEQHRADDGFTWLVTDGSGNLRSLTEGQLPDWVSEAILIPSMP